jgi:hypothetical protein
LGGHGRKHPSPYGDGILIVIKKINKIIDFQDGDQNSIITSGWFGFYFFCN